MSMLSGAQWQMMQPASACHMPDVSTQMLPADEQQMAAGSQEQSDDDQPEVPEQVRSLQHLQQTSPQCRWQPPFLQLAQHIPRSQATTPSARDTGLRHGSSHRPVASMRAVTGSLCVQVLVFCKETEGLFFVQQNLFVCLCNACQDKPEADRTFTGTGFEGHCGAAASKKWKVSCCRVLVSKSFSEPSGLQPCASDATQARLTAEISQAAARASRGGARGW